MRSLKLSIKFSRSRRLLVVVCSVIFAQTVFAQNNGYWDERFSLPGVADGAVFTVAVSGNDLYVGGYFTAAGKEYPEAIAKWNSSTESWTAFGGVFWESVVALAISGNELYACGRARTNYATYSAMIAKWDISKKSWTTIASDISGYVGIIAVMDGSVYVAGTFNQIGDLKVNNIARWDGNSWSALKTGIHGSVHALAVHGKNLYVGGNFDRAGVVSVRNLAQWNGKNWSGLTSGVDGIVETLTMSGNQLYVGGYFSTLGKVSAQNVARWDGKQWWSLGDGILDERGVVKAIAVSENGDVYAGGLFTNATGVAVASIAKWDGRNWSSLNDGVRLLSGDRGHVRSLALAGNELCVGGSFAYAGKVSSPHLAKWNIATNQWSAIRNGRSNGILGEVHAIAASGKDVYVGGDLYAAGTVIVNNIAKWDGKRWFALDDGVNGRVNVIAANERGEIYVGGKFSITGLANAYDIAKWDGRKWFALGSGVGGGTVNSIFIDGNNVYIAGNFYTTGGITVNGIARWNGQKWSSLGGGVPPSYYGPPVYTIAVLNNEVYVGGAFSEIGSPASKISNFAKWNGRRWSEVGGIINGPVQTMTVANENIFIAGRFTKIGNVNVSNVAKWDGKNWSALGTPNMAPPEAIVVKENEVYLGGVLSRDWAGILKWNGMQWIKLGIGVRGFVDENVSGEYVYAVAITDDKVYVGGNFLWAADGNSQREKLANNFAVWHNSVNSSKSAAKGIELSASSFVVTREEQIPAAFELSQNYPNPFNPTTLIRFGLPQDAEVKLEILNLSGQHVATLLQARQAAGYHNVEFDAGHLASGAYFYRLTAANFSAMKKLMLLR